MGYDVHIMPRSEPGAGRSTHYMSFPSTLARSQTLVRHLLIVSGV